MKPVNEKSLLHHLFETMDKVNKDEISDNKADLQVKLTKEAIKLFDLEQRRAKLEMELDVHAATYGRKVEIRELAAKGFDNTTGSKTGEFGV